MIFDHFGTKFGYKDGKFEGRVIRRVRLHFVTSFTGHNPSNAVAKTMKST